MTQRVMTGAETAALEGIAANHGSEPLALVNTLRKDVKRWREGGCEGATTTTRRPFDHWRGDARRARGTRRFFFCQLEAVETVVYTNEHIRSHANRLMYSATAERICSTVSFAGWQRPAHARPGCNSSQAGRFPR
jgi:hypothetical protein